MDNEIELTIESEASVYLPQVIADEEERKTEEKIRKSNEVDRIEAEETRVENEEARNITMNKMTNEIKKVNDLEKAVSSLASGSPLVASSTSEMTDKTRVYVNSTDGHWYYWNKTSWTDGGVYQASEVSDNTITAKKTTFIKNYNEFEYNDNTIITPLYFNSTTKKFVENSTHFGIIQKVKPNTSYTIYKPLSTTFAVVSSANKPEDGVAYEEQITNINTTLITLTTKSTTNYLFILFKLNTETLTDYEILSQLRVYKTEDFVENFSNFYKINNLKLDNLDLDLLPFVKRTNKFNKNDFIKCGYMKNASDNTFVYSSNIKCVLYKCKPNTDYIVSKIHSQRFCVYTSTDFPYKEVNVNQNISQINTNSNYDYLKFTTGNTDNYFVVYYYNSLYDTLTESEILDTLMILESDEALEDYVSYADFYIENKYINNENDITNLSDNMINLLSYKPLGNLTKGYIALSCDDGNSLLATYTIPKLKEYKSTYGKNIPVTFGLMSNSQVFSDNTQKALVQEMIADYGCEVAIHGSNSYTSYTTEGLKEFLDTQKTLLTSLCNAEPKSIIYPNHDYNIKTSTISGSYFGVCCTGGTNKPIKYSHDSAGPRSNMYTLYRMSLLNSSVTKQKIKDMLDYVKANNLIALPFWHDYSLNTDAKKELLDYVVSYGVQIGLDFITVSDIKNII